MNFSCNSKIALYMRNYKLVKEFGEGVDRMFREMEEAGCPAPEYRQNEFMVYATIRQHSDANGDVNSDVNGDVNSDVNNLKGSLKDIYKIVHDHPGIKIGEVAEIRGKTESTVWKQLNELKKKGLLEYRGSDKTGGYYVIKE